MKKILSIVLTLVMLISASAFAEELVIAYDPAVFETLGVEVTTLSLDDYGLWLDIPSEMLVLEISEEEAATGTVAAFSTEDGSYAISVGFSQVLDAEGNYFEDYESLSAYYAELGATDMEIADINGLYAMSYVLPEYDMMGAVYLFDEGWVLAFNFSGASDEGLAALNVGVLSSVRPAE